MLNTDIEIIADNLSDILKEFDNKILLPGGMGFLGKYFILFFDYLIKNYKFNLKIYVLDT